MNINTESRKTITSIFMMPTLGYNIIALKKLGYIAAYAKDSMKEIQHEDSIYALFKPNNLENFNAFLQQEYIRTPLIIEDYDYSDGYVVIVYKQIPEFKKDYDLIKKGKYSKTSKEFQNLFQKNVFIYTQNSTKEEISIQYKIFNKTRDLIDYWEEKIGQSFDSAQEYWSAYDIDFETLKLENGN